MTPWCSLLRRRRMLRPSPPCPCSFRRSGTPIETISWSEGDDTYVSLEATDELSITLRLGADGNPVWAEFLLGGEAVSQCEITQFTISEA